MDDSKKSSVNKQDSLTSAEHIVIPVKCEQPKLIICDMCGHANPEYTAICKMCSNYLVRR